MGGVNEKIEGFFAICKTRQLTGNQGVIIPAANQINLMLSDEVVSAIEKGLFHIYTVNSVDETLALLCDEHTGEEMNNGHFPHGSINQRIVAQLINFSQKSQISWES